MRFWMTPHAEKRRIEMHLTTDQVREVLEDPESTYVLDKRRWNRRGDIAVITPERTNVVITILWDQADGRDDDGRPVFR
jgi:hypothetical protein